MVWYGISAMAYATLEQLNDRLLVIDDLLFKISTGQVSAGAEEQQRLTSEADWIMGALAKGISEGGEHDYQAAWDARQKVRNCNWSAVASRHVELHPEPNPEQDRLIANAFAEGATAEDSAAMMEMFSYMFVELPTVPAKPKAPKGFFRRLFRGR